ncbi:class I SAM-dependent methyltransferase [Chamaesiphon polymorphus]|uniref:Methyltransferase n=1 Tax=Chamaesiphon polymorphus CCALA 037 TaxID=2107692 RepID=A0A2T1GMA8_9CYAN|nr:methyltransferase domain-containing protein [Chamaesiphon polymorphus]PSB59031.1 methyltransferase [Chamaesiphon polymorphus CCALA 037]
MLITEQNPPQSLLPGQMVQFGCGLCAPTQWQNFDASPTLRLQKLPVVGPLVPAGEFGRFPANVKYGNIVKGLPIPDESVQLLYCSHVLEHLTLDELRQALRNCYRHLQPGGIFRFVLPDLEFMSRQYLSSTDPDAALEFMRVTWMGIEHRQRDLRGFLKEWLGGSQHLWMWDYKSLARELSAAGFQDIRRAELGDSGIAEFSELEDPQRWQNELGIQCHK